jgi:hypothetical protein
MHQKLAVLAILLMAAMMPIGVSAQGLNAGLSGSSGGVGIGPNGTGFFGTMGDPLYQAERAPGQFIPGYPVTNHASIGDAGAEPVTVIGVPGYPPPPPPPIQYQYGPPGAR